MSTNTNIDWTKIGQQQPSPPIVEEIKAKRLKKTFATGMSFDMEIDAIELVPLYEQLVPRPSAEEYSQLKADIEVHGIQIPLLIDNYGRLIDGYTRYQIAKELGLKDVPVIVDEFTEESAQLRVIELNLHRRQLTDSQRVELAAKIRGIEQQRARERKERTQFAKKETTPALPAKENTSEKTPPTKPETDESLLPPPSGIKPTPTGETSNVPPETPKVVPTEEKSPISPEEAGSSVKKMAEKVGLKPSKLKQGLIVFDEAQNNPEVKKKWEDVQKQKKSIHQAYNETKRVKKQEEMRNNPPKPPDPEGPLPECKMFWGDAFTALGNTGNFPPDSVHGVPLIATSPVYGTGKDETGTGYVDWAPEDWEKQFKRFVKLARRALSPSGLLVVILGVQPRQMKNGVIEHLPLDSLAIPICRAEGLGCVRQIAWAFNAGVVGGKNSLNGRHESVCIFAKGPGYTFNAEDIRVPAKTDDARNPPDDLVNPGDVWYFERVTNETKLRNCLIHPCRFPPGLIERIIKLCSKPGDLVVDPFVGSGTTLTEAIKLGRKAIGIEINKNYVADVHITLGEIPYVQEDVVPPPPN